MESFRQRFSWEDLHQEGAYGGELAQLKGLKTPPSWVRAIRVSLGTERGRLARSKLVYVDEELLKENPPDYVLRHLAGIARVRYELQAPIEQWRVDRNPVHRDYTPDAIWERHGGRLAVEYDVGYQKQKVIDKMWAFHSIYSGQIWGVATPRRKAFIEEMIPASLRRNIIVVLAPWF